MSDTYFANRSDAGKQLAAALGRLKDSHPLVLGLPRGGVPVAFEVANALDADLDVLIVRKLGAPGQEELGIGALVDGPEPQLVLNEEVVRAIGVSQAYIQAEFGRQLREIERRRKLYRGNRAPLALHGRTVILVDDGIATGGTVKAALRGVRKAGAGHVVLAVPVAPAETIERLRRECDELVCLAAPDIFYAVGAFYANFTQTSDAEVIALLDAAADNLERVRHAASGSASRQG